MDVTEIEKRVDRAIASAIPVDADLGGLTVQDMGQVMEFAKLMAVSGAAVPIHLRGNPGACLAICTKAVRFRFDPFALAEHSYSMWKSVKIGNTWTDVETIAYDSFVLHAIIEAHGQVTGQLKPTYQGEGDDLTCTCTGVINGETLTITSPRLGDIKARIGRNDKGTIKGSPLWDSKPRQQIWYDVRRDWCRAFQPHILLGWYDKDELMEHGARDVTPQPPPDKIEGLAKRLKEAKASQTDRGFNAEHVAREAAQRNSIIEGEVDSGDAEPKGETNYDQRSGDESVADSGGQGQSGDRANDNRDQGRSGGAVGDDPEDGGKPARQKRAEPDQSEIFPPDRDKQTTTAKPKPKGKR